MSQDLVDYLIDSANRLREIAQDKPKMAEKLRALAASLEAKASEIEATLRRVPPDS
jgi:hypothetical protein